MKLLKCNLFENITIVFLPMAKVTFRKTSNGARKALISTLLMLQIASSAMILGYLFIVSHIALAQLDSTSVAEKITKEGKGGGS